MPGNANSVQTRGTNSRGAPAELIGRVGAATVNMSWRYGGAEVSTAVLIIIIIIIMKRRFIRRSNMARVTTRAPYNVRCSYSAKQLVSEVGT